LPTGIGRLGCLLAGDGTYGRPSGLPWAMAFPNGTVPTAVPVRRDPALRGADPVHSRRRAVVAAPPHYPLLVFAAYLVGSGTAGLRSSSGG